MKTRENSLDVPIHLFQRAPSWAPLAPLHQKRGELHTPEEGLRADIAFELFDPEVSFDMQPVLGARGEGSRAQVTLEWSVPGVDPDVLLQVPLLAEHLRTEGTLE